MDFCELHASILVDSLVSCTTLFFAGCRVLIRFPRVEQAKTCLTGIWGMYKSCVSLLESEASVHHTIEKRARSRFLRTEVRINPKDPHCVRTVSEHTSGRPGPSTQAQWLKQDGRGDCRVSVRLDSLKRVSSAAMKRWSIADDAMSIVPWPGYR